MALAQLPTCIVKLPPVVPPFRSHEVVLPSLRPVAPASEGGANVVVCLTGAAEPGVDVSGPSLPVCPCVAKIGVVTSVWCQLWCQVISESLSA